MSGRTVWGLVALLLAASSADLDAQASWREITRSRQLAGESSLNVDVRYGAGELRIRPGSPGTLYRMQLRYDEELFEPLADYEPGRLRIGIDGVEGSVPVRRDVLGGSLDLELATGVPMTVDLELGAVRADVDLGGLSMTDLRLQTGASETRVDVSTPNPVRLRQASLEAGAAAFTASRLGNLNADRIEVSAGVGSVTLELDGEWRRDATIEVEMGLGSLELRIPEGLGVRLVRETVLTSLDPEGLIKRGDVYYSPDWERADRRVTVDVDAAFGSIKVVWLR